MQYLVVIHKDPNSDYGVIVPDLPGCFSAGKTIEEALLNAHEAIECHLEGMLVDGDPIPTQLHINEHINNPDYKDDIFTIIDVDLSKISGRAKRINITLPEKILKQIDAYTESHGGNRSAVIADAALYWIEKQHSDTRNNCITA